MSKNTRFYVIQFESDGELITGIKEVSTASPVPQNVIHRCEEISKKKAMTAPCPEIIHNHQVKQYVGIGFIILRKATETDFINLKILNQ